MSHQRLDSLQVLVIGIEGLISREVVRELVAEGALVTAAGTDELALTRLQRDLGLYRTTVTLAPIDLFSTSEMGLFSDNLRAQGRLPHMVVCCCDGGDCPAEPSVRQLQPSLVLHVLPRAPGRFGRAVASLHIPTLAALLDRSRNGGLFDAGEGPQRALIAGQVFTLRRAERAPPSASGRRVQPRRSAAASIHPAPRRNERQETS